jgi:hypothetical protein
MKQKRQDREKAQAEAAAKKDKSVDEALLEMYEADQRGAGVRKINSPDKNRDGEE